MNRILSLIFAYVLLFGYVHDGTTAETAMNNSIRTQLDTARELSRNPERLKDAIDLYRSLISEGKLDNDELLAEAHYFLGRSYLLASRQDVSTYEEGMAMLMESRELFEYVIKNYPHTSWLYDASRQLAEIHFSLHDYSKVINIINNWPMDDIRDGMVKRGLYLLGEAYRRTGQMDEARNAFERIIDNFPDSRWAVGARSQLRRVERNDSGYIPSSPISLPVGYHRRTYGGRLKLNIDGNLTLAYNVETTLRDPTKVITPENTKSLSVKFYAKEEKVTVKINGNKVESPHRIHWEKGPGPFVITFDDETGLASKERVEAKADLIIKEPFGKKLDMKVASDEKVFVVSDYLKSLAEDEPVD